MGACLPERRIGRDPRLTVNLDAVAHFWAIRLLNWQLSPTSALSAQDR